MAEITRKIRLFNEAYRIAWQRLTVDGEARPATDMAVRLRDNIQTLVRAGHNDVDEIVALIIARMR
jgi:fructose-1,6-bisphosphatase/sedoheptulose 1,7-bisphosphatase-like protein